MTEVVDSSTDAPGQVVSEFPTDQPLFSGQRPELIIMDDIVDQPEPAASESPAEDTKTSILPMPAEDVAPGLFQLLESDQPPEPTLSIAETILNWRDEVLAEPQPSWQLVHPHTWFKQSVERLIGKL